MMEELQPLIDEIIEELTTELTADDEAGNFSEILLQAKVKDAVREVIELRRYPNGYSNDRIANDMNRLYSKIKGRALYRYNQIGAEGETSHEEKNIARTYDNIDNLFPILAISRLF